MQETVETGKVALISGFILQQFLFPFAKAILSTIPFFVSYFDDNAIIVSVRTCLMEKPFEFKSR